MRQAWARHVQDLERLKTQLEALAESKRRETTSVQRDRVEALSDVSDDLERALERVRKRVALFTTLPIVAKYREAINAPSFKNSVGAGEAETINLRRKADQATRSVRRIFISLYLYIFISLTGSASLSLERERALVARGGSQRRRNARVSDFKKERSYQRAQDTIAPELIRLELERLNALQKHANSAPRSHTLSLSLSMRDLSHLAQTSCAGPSRHARATAQTRAAFRRHMQLEYANAALRARIAQTEAYLAAGTPA